MFSRKLTIGTVLAITQIALISSWVKASDQNIENSVELVSLQTENDNWCNKPIDWAVAQGSRQFTKKMVNNLSRAAQQIDTTKNSEQATRCIIKGLQKRKLPYQF